MKTLDYLPNTQIYLHQRKDMFRMNTDTALLGQFMKINKDEVVLDIGTNNAALLLYASQFSPSLLIGLDVQPDACELAIENLEYNHITNYEIHCCDIKDYQRKVNVIICNPPYFKTNGDNQVNESMALRIARHECYLTLDVLCERASTCLDDKGRFYMVHRCDRIVEIVECLKKYHLEIKTLQFVRDEEKENAHGVLIEAIKQASTHCTVLKEKIVTR